MNVMAFVFRCFLFRVGYVPFLCSRLHGQSQRAVITVVARCNRPRSGLPVILYLQRRHNLQLGFSD